VHPPLFVYARIWIDQDLKSPVRAAPSLRAATPGAVAVQACGHQTSVTAGTVLHRTRTSLRDWFWAAYLATTHTPGLSALQLQRQLGIRR
jgi:hypothetical protein